MFDSDVIKWYYILLALQLALGRSLSKYRDDFVLLLNMKRGIDSWHSYDDQLKCAPLVVCFGIILL